MKKIYLFLIALFLIKPIDIYALKVGEAIAGGGVTVGDCDSSWDWCFQNRAGVRISLYSYKDGKLNYYGSKDIESKANSSSIEKFNAHYVTSAAGKFAYRHNGYKINWSSKQVNLKMDDDDKIAGTKAVHEDSAFAGNVKDYILNKFNLSTNDKSKILKSIKKYFETGEKIKESMVPYLYITAEPTFLVVNLNGKGQYYGTAYEMLQLPHINNTKGYYGINGLIYNGFSTTIFSEEPKFKDYNNFLKDIVQPVKNLKNLYSYDATVYNSDCIAEYRKKTNKTATGASTCRKHNLKELDTDKGYGVGFIWVGEKMSCNQTCDPEDTRNKLLKCAENYCHKNLVDASTEAKKACINSCGYVPEDKKCPPSNNGTETTTKCGGTKKSSKKTCKETTYFITQCEEETKITYPNLTSTMHLNENKTFFSLIKTNGTKICTKEFKYELFQFNYASETTPARRKSLKDSLDNDFFNNTDYGSNANSFVKYATTAGSWEIKKIQHNGSTEELKWSKISSNNQLKSKQNKTLHFFSNGEKETKCKQCEKQYIYKKIYVSKVEGEIKTNSSLNYDSNTLGSKNIKTEIKRESSNLHNSSTCSYKVKESGSPTEELSCSGKIASSSIAANGEKTSNIEFTVSYKTRENKDAAVDIHDNLKGKLKYSIDGGPEKDFIDNELTIRDTLVLTEGTSGVKTMQITSITSGETYSCSVEDSSIKKTCALSITNEYSSDKVKVDVTTTGTISSIECTYKDGSEELALKSLSGNKYEGKISGILSEDTPGTELNCRAELTNGESCEKASTIGSCKYIPAAKVDKINIFCEDFASKIGKYDYTSEPEAACKQDCAACPKHPDGSKYSIEEIEPWCIANYAIVGYVDEYACMSGCGEDYGPYIFRPITLGKSDPLSLTPYNAFPNRKAGSNWFKMEHKTVEDVFEGTPIYTINLTSQDIKKIKEKTNELAKDEAYTPYERLEKEKKKEQYESKFIREDFKQIFCINGSGEGCDE